MGMAFTSARDILGLPVIDKSTEHEPVMVLGTVETVTVNPKTCLINGLFMGRVGTSGQVFLPRECILEITEHALVVSPRFIRKPSDARRILGLSAWTTHPRFFVGLVHNVHFSLESGYMESLTIHQLIRTWRVPASAIAKITPRTIVIDSDTTLKLKITPLKSRPA